MPYACNFYRPVNPNKYRGDVNNIVYRSSWEKRAFIWADLNPSVVEWSSEEVIVPYYCETDGKWHRYFIDLFLKIRGKDGVIREFLVEIKPKSKTEPPKKPSRMTKRYLKEVEEFVKNQSKWKAAKHYAQQRGYEFLILTENELGIKH